MIMINKDNKSLLLDENINDLDNRANIKVIYWKLKCKEDPSFRGYEI